jgi:hypothetical protein
MSKIFSMNTLFLKNIDILLKDILNIFKYKQLFLKFSKKTFLGENGDELTEAIEISFAVMLLCRRTQLTCDMSGGGS